MGSISRLPLPAGAAPVYRFPTEAAAPARSVRLTILGMACFLCGATIGVKFEFVGDLYLLEVLVAVLALQCVLSRGLGRGFVVTLFMSFVGAGLITLCGYLLADLIAANEPWQYLRGWARVAFLITDITALMVLAAHDRRNVWWLALGIAIGGIVSLAIDGVPVTQWKLGYGEYVALLLLTLAPLASSWFAGALLCAFGVFSVLADYRSLGAACLVVAAIVLWRLTYRVKSMIRNGLLLTSIVLALVTLLAILLSSTDQEYFTRREQSNIGRYVGLVVAWRAIAESPLIGYGSWAADRSYGRMMRDEARRMNQDERHPAEVSESLLPHSQFLQAWIEGGLLGITFFLMLGIRSVAALSWFTLSRPIDVITPLGVYFLILGVWNLAASPFLGVMRIYIAVAIAIISISAYERGKSAQPGVA